MARRLTRNSRDAMLGGVASGFADYFDIDPVLARLGFILLCFLNGLGLLFYIVCWIIMPRDDTPEGESTPGAQVAEEMRDTGEKVAQEMREAGEKVAQKIKTADAGRGQIVGGAILIALGFIFLLDQFSWWYWPDWLRFRDLWPLILVAAGLAMMIRSGGGERA